VKQHVAENANIVTDDSPVYKRLAQRNQHDSVNHSEREYLRMEGARKIHTNSVESSFSLLKRGIVGTFHHISTQHLAKYVAEFDHRWNTRHDSDTARTQSGLKKSRGKRLTYAPMMAESYPAKAIKVRQRAYRPKGKNMAKMTPEQHAAQIAKTKNA
jgi:hypothetical protein